MRLYQLKDGKTTDITEPVNPGIGGNPDTKMKTIEGAVEHFCFFGIGIPNRAPVANAGADLVVKAESGKGAEIVLDGSLSYDPDASLEGLKEPDFTPDGRSIVSYKWTGPFGEAEGVRPTVVIPPGLWECTITVSDGWLESQDTVTVNVKKAEDNGNDEDDEEDDDEHDDEYSSFPYTIFSGSNDSPVLIFGANIEIGGDLHTNNNLLFLGFNFAVDGICKSVGEIVAIGNNVNIKTKEVNAETIEMPDWTGNIRAGALKNGKQYNTDKIFAGDEINLTMPAIFNGSLSVDCTTLNLSKTIYSSGSISVNASECKSIGEERVVICSENGDIVINTSNFELNGLIYAPNGTVVINANSFTLNGKIVANNVLIRGSKISIKNISTTK